MLPFFVGLITKLILLRGNFLNKKYYFEEIFIFNPDYVFVNVEFVEK